MKQLLLSILLSVGIMAQNSSFTQWSTPPPPAPNVSITTSMSGANNYYYWVVSTFPIGKVIPSPVLAQNVAIPSGSNTIVLSWSNNKATSYDIVRTLTNTFPTSGASAALTTGIACCSYTDNGGALGAYTYTTQPGTVVANLTLDNQNNAIPKLVSDTPLLVPSIGTVSITFGNLPTTVSNGTQFYCSDCGVAPTCAAGGTGAIAIRLNNAWVCGSGSGGGGTGTVTHTVGALTVHAVMVGNGAADSKVANTNTQIDDSGNTTTNTVTTGDGTVAGTVAIYPANDPTNSITLSTGTRTGPIKWNLPVTDPTTGQVMTCTTPSVGVSTCSFTSNSPTTTALATTPTQCSGVTFAKGIAANGNANCDTPSGGGGGAATSTILLNIGAGLGGIITGPWTNAASYASGSYLGFNHIDLPASASPFLTTQFRLPHNFDKTKTVTVSVMGFDNGGVLGNVRVNVDIGCYVDGQNVYLSPTYGTALVLNPNITVPSGTASASGTLTLGVACDSDVMALLRITRDNTVGSNLVDPWMFSDLSFTYNVK